MVSEEEIQDQLGRILGSPVFINSERSRQFLEHCVNCSLRGENSQLKETTIAIAVFLREATYDPKSDPIVRVHARRVREKLDIYYRTAGRRDPITIELPKGSYVPHFARSIEMPEPVVAVKNAGQENIETPSLPEPDPTQHRQRSPAFRRRIYLVATVVLVLIVAGWIGVRRYRSERTVALASLEAVTALPSDAADVAWSQNGKLAAFTQIDPVMHRSYVATLNLSMIQNPQILHTEGVPQYRPVWSPDGRQVAYIRMLDDLHFAIVRHDLASGAEVVSRPFVSYFPLSVDHPTLDWSPDGETLLTSEEISPNTPMRLVRMRVRDGERTNLTSPPVGSSGDIEAKFSADGKLVAFRRGGQGDLYVVNADGGGSVKRLTFDTRGVRGIAFSEDSKSIFFGTDHSSNETFGIYRIPVVGGDAMPVTPDGFAAASPARVRPGVFSLQHVELATQIVAFERGQTSQSEIIPSGGIDTGPAFSPDGSSIAFVSTRSGGEELWLQHRSDRSLEQLSHFYGSGFLFDPHWSPDGQRVSFSFRAKGATNVMIYNLRTRQFQTLTNTRSRDFNPIFSHDGRYMFFSSNEDGSSRIWRIAVDGTQAAEPMFTEAVMNFVPSADGQWLYYIDNRQPLALFRANLLDGTTQEVFHTDLRPALTNCLVVTREGIYLAVAHGDDIEATIERIDPVTFHAETVWKIPKYGETTMPLLQGFDVSQDGKSLLTTRLTRHSSSLFQASIR